jgi:hypothetical protein
MTDHQPFEKETETERPKLFAATISKYDQYHKED